MLFPTCNRPMCYPTIDFHMYMLLFPGCTNNFVPEEGGLLQQFDGLQTTACRAQADQMSDLNDFVIYNQYHLPRLRLWIFCGPSARLRYRTLPQGQGPRHKTLRRLGWGSVLRPLEAPLTSFLSVPLFQGFRRLNSHKTRRDEEPSAGFVEMVKRQQIQPRKTWRKEIASLSNV